MKSSDYQEEPTIPDLNRKNETLQLFYLLLHLGPDRDCGKLKVIKQTVNTKKHMLRYDIKSKCLDLMRYSLLYSFPGFGCFPDKEKELDELLLCPSMDIFVYGKTHNSFFTSPPLHGGGSFLSERALLGAFCVFEGQMTP